MSQEEVNRKLSCILSTDVVGYSRLMEENEASTVRYLEENKKLISGLIEQHNGRVVDSPGDNLLAEFSSAVKAVDCAVKIQKELKIKNADLIESKRMQFRIGINLGDVIEEDGRLYGSGVNIASRIEGLSDSGGICISRNVYDQVKNKLDLGYDYLGEHEVKNITELVQVYRVQTGIMSGGQVDKNRHRGLSVKIVIATALIIIAGLVVWKFYSSVPEEQVPKTIAVIPFENISSDPEQENFVDGLSEQIINDLTKISNLSVTSRTSSFVFKDSDKTAKEIAKILQREYILEGSVRKAGNALKITAQLIRAADDSHLWSETYDRELKDIFEIQGDIAKNVADKLKLTLEAFQLLGGTENVDAYELYLKAKGKRNEANISGYKDALELLDAAIDLDPEFALAWAFKAQNHLLLSYYGESPIADRNYALKAAQRAIEIEPNLADGYIHFGTANKDNKNFIIAEKHFRKALEIMEGSSSVDTHFIVIHYLEVGKFKEAHQLLDKIRLDDPISPFLAWYYPTHGFLGDRQQAEMEYQRRNKLMTKGYSDWHDQTITQVRLGSGDKLFEYDIVSSEPINLIGKKYLESPKEGLMELRDIYNRDKGLSSMELGAVSVWAAYFGDYNLAMEVTEYNRDIFRTWFPIMREVRKMPRFKKYIREIGLVDYWKEFGWPDLCHPVGDDDFVCE